MAHDLIDHAYVMKPPYTTPKEQDSERAPRLMNLGVTAAEWTGEAPHLLLTLFCPVHPYCLSEQTLSYNKPVI